MNKKQIIGIVVAAVLFVFISASSMLVRSQTESLLADMESDFGQIKDTIPGDDFIGVININGTIADVGSSDWFTTVEYDHQGILDFIDEMIDNKDNVGLFLNIDSPGGYTYEIVEMYDKLEKYKEQTGRPIYAYCGSYTCSGGYYLAVTADKIYANPNSIVGSIGVIISTYDYSELMAKIGVKEINIASGKNKAMGSGGTAMTEEQLAIYQSIVDESYESFVTAVEKGRGLKRDQVYKLADGRIYSANQALDAGMVDGVAGYEDFLELMSDDFNHAEYYTFGQDEYNFFSLMFQKAENLLPKSDSQINTELLDKYKNGGLMYYADLS